MKRREFILGTAAAGVSVAARELSRGDYFVQEENALTAEEALKELMDGNERFVSGNSKHPRASEKWLRRLTKGQRPLATILTCSDSRVPLELLFDQGFGDIFAVRVAGNVVTRYGIGSMEYAQHHLETALFIVLGHEGCGAVTAAMLPKEERDLEPKGIRELLDLINVGTIDPKIGAKEKLKMAVETNARNSTRRLLNLDPKTEGFNMRETNLLVTAVYELDTGRVRILDKHGSTRKATDKIN